MTIPAGDGRPLALRAWAALSVLLAAAMAFQFSHWTPAVWGRNLSARSLHPTANMPVAKSNGARVPIIAELFTSEGCSSCPPADDVLTRLIETQPVLGVDIIGLSEHVDYWDRLGWRDPFSSADFSARQSDYASRVFHTRSIYTPQVVIGGREELVGSDFDGVVKAVARIARQPAATVTIAAADPPEHPQATVIPVIVKAVWRDAPPSSEAGDVMWAIVEDGLTSEVHRGENAGRHLSHSAVVRRLTRDGELSPQSPSTTLDRSLTLEPAWSRAHLKLVVFVQERRTGAVIGASTLALAP